MRTVRVPISEDFTPKVSSPMIRTAALMCFLTDVDEKYFILPFSSKALIVVTGDDSLYDSILSTILA